MQNIKSVIPKNTLLFFLFMLSVSFAAVTAAGDGSKKSVDMSKCVQGIDVSHY
jgi:hypothetical protein